MTGLQYEEQRELFSLKLNEITKTKVKSYTDNLSFVKKSIEQISVTLSYLKDLEKKVLLSIIENTSAIKDLDAFFLLGKDLIECKEKNEELIKNLKNYQVFLEILMRKKSTSDSFLELYNQNIDNENFKTIYLSRDK